MALNCIINQAFSFIFFFFSKYESISLAPLEVKCGGYLRSLTIHLLISLIILFPVTCPKLQITRTFNFSISLEGSSYWESTVLIIREGPLEKFKEVVSSKG